METLSSSDRSLNRNPLMSHHILSCLSLSSGTKQNSAAIQAHKALFCHEEGFQCQRRISLSKLNKRFAQSNVPVENLRPCLNKRVYVYMTHRHIGYVEYKRVLSRIWMHMHMFLIIFLIIHIVPLIFACTFEAL